MDTEVQAQFYLYNIHSLHNSTKHCMLVVQPWSGHCGNKELEPLVFGPAFAINKPAFAINTVKGLSCRKLQNRNIHPVSLQVMTGEIKYSNRRWKKNQQERHMTMHLELTSL